MSPQGEQFNMKLDKGPRGFGFSLVAAPTFSSDVSDFTEPVVVFRAVLNNFIMIICVIKPKPKQSINHKGHRQIQSEYL